MKKDDKKNLFRIARIKVKQEIGNKQVEVIDEVILDKDQNMGGRGSYICSNKCLEKSLEKMFLKKRLRTNIDVKSIEKIKKTINNLAMEEK